MRTKTLKCLARSLRIGGAAARLSLFRLVLNVRLSLGEQCRASQRCLVIASPTASWKCCSRAGVGSRSCNICRPSHIWVSRRTSPHSAAATLAKVRQRSRPAVCRLRAGAASAMPAAPPFPLNAQGLAGLAVATAARPADHAHLFRPVLRLRSYTRAGARSRLA